MSADGSQIGQQQFDDNMSATDLIDRLIQFDGPVGEFLVHLLAVQCRLADAVSGAILRPGPDGRIEALAVYPPPADSLSESAWLAHAAGSTGQVISSGNTTVKPLHGQDELYGQPARQNLVMIPLKASAESVRGLAVFVVETADQVALATSRERLELTVSLLSLYEMRLTLQHRQVDLTRMRMAMEVLVAVNAQDRFTGAAMAFCNELAARWRCERVSLGFLKGRYVYLKAMSHTEKFSRKMKVVQDIESAMEECLDQDVEVFYPPATDAQYVSRAAGELSKRHGPTAMISLPLRKAGEPVAVLTAERPSDNPVVLDEIEPLRLACELCTARMVDMHDQDRWFGAKAAAAARKGLAVLIGPKHTWLKVAAMVVFAAIAFLVFAKGDYRAEGTFVLEATQQQVISAPFDGFLKSVSVIPDDPVIAGETVLAELYTSELRLQLAAAKAERQMSLKQAAAAMRDGKTAQAQVARAEAAKITAQIRLLEHRIGKARIVSPMTGTVISGDLKRQIGAPVKTGNVLFEVAPLKLLRAELSVPEDEIAEVGEGQYGELSAAAYPDRRVQFIVEHINPVAEVVNQQNIFRVRVRLLETKPWMRPGMEGIAKIDIDQRRYAWLWSRKIINWARMKLWL
ncbi:MAG: efflux RND transporter periplasmic adaptor subunit [Phycisphaerae bacterium]|nr:efflux RND transporter periplasmic adaptor subunit [Phycisphaerae bacterium]